MLFGNNKMDSRVLNKILLLLGLFLLAAIILVAGPVKLLEAVSRANLWLLLAAAVFLLAATLLNSLRFHLLAKPSASLSPADSLYLVCFSQLVNQGASAMLGDAAKALLLKKMHNLSYSKGVGIIWVERSLDVLFSLICVGFILGSLSPQGFYLAIAIGLLLLLAWLAVLFSPESLLALIPLEKAKAGLLSFQKTVKGIGVNVIAKSLACTFFAFTATGLGALLLLSALGYNLDFFTVLGVVFAGFLAGIASGLPGGLGSREAAMAFIFAQFGVPVAVTVSVSLLLRVIISAESFVICQLFPASKFPTAFTHQN